MCSDSSDLSASLPVSRVKDRGVPSAGVDAQLLDDLVAANHVLYKHRVVDAFGHVSVRHDKDRERFLLARNVAPALVEAADIVEFHLDGTPVNAAGRPVYLERFIHGEIYRRRPDVAAVVHSHAPAVVPFGVARGAALRPVWHMSAFLGSATPVFEIRDHAGEETDLLIRSAALGEALAVTLGDANVVLMRGHGATVVGDTLKQAVYRSVFTQMNAELQLQATLLGETIFLTDGECEAASRSVGSQVDRAWDLWRSEASSAPGARR